MERKYQKLVITLENVGQADAIALIKMFKYMEHLGRLGASRWCSFYADGDGAFRPKVSFEYPEELPEVPEIDGRTVSSHIGSMRYTSDFAIDSDEIAWKIYN